jgi:hypothetical protein
LHLIWESDINSDISSSHEALRSVSSQERLVTTTFLRLENIELTDEVSADIQRVRLNKAHSSLNLILGYTSKENTDIITGLTVVKLLLECFDTGNGGRGRLSLNTNHVDFITDFTFTLLDSSGNDSTSSWDVN